MKQTATEIVRQESRKALLDTLLKNAQTLGQTFELEKQNTEWLEQVNQMRIRAERDVMDDQAPQEARSLALGILRTLSHNKKFLEGEARKLSVREKGLKRLITVSSIRLLKSL